MMAEPLFTSITGVSWLVSLEPFLILWNGFFAPGSF
jgi:hypothetical protein